ncbi:MAG: IS1182 family transposase [Thermoplasmata archaeon]|jgi:transposase
MDDAPEANFRRYDPHQNLILPPNLDEWLPEGHLARFIGELVDDQVDLTPFTHGYDNAEGGRLAFHPALLLKLWLYGYCVGVPSSRKVARATFDDLAFRWLATDQHPTYSTLARFRERNLTNFHTLFLQVLKLCQEADLIGGTRMALDGTKVKASASKHKAMSHGKMLEKEKQLDEELKKSIEEYFRKVAETDAEEDRKFGKGNNPYLGDPTIRSKKDRLERIRKAKEALEERERQKAKAAGKEAVSIDPKTQYNFTDPDSRIMPDGANRGSFVQAYNCQAMVDEKAQIIVAAEATQAPQDKRQLLPMTEVTIGNLGRVPKEVDVDGGYFSEEAIREVEGRGIDVYCPPERGKTAERTGCPRGRPPLDETFAQKMRRKVRSVKGRAHYRHRKFVVEPVFGQMKQGRGLRQFLLRGFAKVEGEWKLWSLTHNLRKLHLASLA